jgi:hypothetical protein
MDKRRMKQKSFLTQGNLSHIKPLRLWVSSTTYSEIATFTPKSPKLRKYQNHHFFCNNSNHKPESQFILETHCNKLNKCAHAHIHTNTKNERKGNTHFTKQLGRKNTQIRERERTCNNKYTSRKKRCTLHLKGANTKL